MADVPELAARLFLRVVFEIATYYTGKGLLWVVSLGGCKAEGLGAAPKPRRRRFERQPDGTLSVDSGTTRLIGMVALLATFVVVVLIWRGFFMGCPSKSWGPDGACIY